jgi:hypothetical protein
VINRDHGARYDRDESDTASDTSLQATQEDQGSMETGLPTPQSSNGQASEALTSPVEVIGTVSQDSPQQLDSPHTGIFPMPQSFSFGQATRTNPSFHSPHEAIGAPYGSGFVSQPMTRTSTTTSMLSPDVPRDYDLFVQTPLGQAPSGVPAHLSPQSSASYGWPHPFHHEFFSPIDYNSGSRPEMAPSPHFGGYHSFPTSQAHDVAPHQISQPLN